MPGYLRCRRTFPVWSILLICCLVLFFIVISPAAGASTSKDLGASCHCDDPSHPTKDTCMCLSGYMKGELCVHTHKHPGMEGAPQNYSTPENPTPFCECCVTMFLPMCDFRTGCINKPDWGIKSPVFPLPKGFLPEKETIEATSTSTQTPSSSSSAGKGSGGKEGIKFDILSMVLGALLGFYAVYALFYILRRRKARKDAETRDMLKTHILDE